jgi:hypothetical protein
VPLRNVLLVAVAATTVAACGGESAGDAERFCGEVASSAEWILSPDLAHEEDVDELLDRYRSIGRFAPLAVEEEWERLVSAYETASTVVLDDADSEQVMLTAIYSSEESAAAIAEWLMANCAVDIGPVATIVAQGG